MLTYRRADPERDRDFVLEMHSLRDFESESPWVRPASLHAYRERWFRTPWPQSFLEDLRRSLEDERTLAEVWEEDGRPVGFLWMTFSEIDGYGVTVAEINDIEVAPSHQRLGIGTLMVQHAEEVARQQGAQLLRSKTGTENVASQSLHASAGFRLYGMLYEKRLDGDGSSTGARADI